MISPEGHYAGWMTKGILHKESYYHRGVYMDAIRALQVLSERLEVHSDRIGVTGGSQGGALALAAAALSDIPRVVVAEYPYLSHFRRAIDVAPTGPYFGNQRVLSAQWRRFCRGAGDGNSVLLRRHEPCRVDSLSHTGGDRAGR